MQAFNEPKVGFGLVGLAPGADADTVKRTRSTGLLKARYPEAEAKTAKQFIDDQAGQVNQLLGLIYALLALAIIVSLFGIVNTLVLVDPRAHARARDAARDRHVAPAGARRSCATRRSSRR